MIQAMDQTSNQPGWLDVISCLSCPLLKPVACCARWTRIPLQDVEGEAIHEHFQAAADFIQEAEDAGGAALVHCHEGRSRSVTLVLAYLLHTQARLLVGPNGTSACTTRDACGHRASAHPSAHLACLLAVQHVLVGHGWEPWCVALLSVHRL